MGDSVIWGEVLFCIDFSMDFCALYFTCKLLGWKIRLKNLTLSAVICSAVGVFCTAVLNGLLSAAVMVFGWIGSALLLSPTDKRNVRSMTAAFLLFVFLEACAGGIMTAVFCFLNRRFYALDFTVSDYETKRKWFFLCAGLVFIILGVICRLLSHADVQKLVQRSGIAAIRWNGHETSVACMFDSGNLIKEPISGKSVMILPYKEQFSLGVDPKLLESGGITGSRLISMKTLDRAYLMWGIRPDSIDIRADSLEISGEELYIVFSDGTDKAIVPTSMLR